MQNEDVAIESEPSAATSTCTAANPGNAVISSSAVSEEVSNKKVSRLCIFCRQFHTNLSRHIVLVHKDREEVQELITKPKFERCRLLQTYKRQGILEFNKQQMKLVSPMYQRERRVRKVECGFTVCEYCSGCLSKKTFYAHKARCKAESNRPKPKPISFPLLSLPSTYKGKLLSYQSDEIFNSLDTISGIEFLMLSEQPISN